MRRREITKEEGDWEEEEEGGCGEGERMVERGVGEGLAGWLVGGEGKGECAKFLKIIPVVDI